MGFRKEMYDNMLHRKHMEQFERHSENVKAFREALSTEGMTNDKEMILRLTKNEDSLESYINELRDSYIKGIRFLPKEEEARIRRVYFDLFERLEPFVGKVMLALKEGIELKKDGTVDLKTVEKVAKERATVQYDTDSLSAFYKVFLNAVNAMKSLKKYQKEKGIIDQSDVWYNIDGTLMEGNVTRATRRDGDLPTEDFQNIYGKYFKK